MKSAAFSHFFYTRPLLLAYAREKCGLGRPYTGLRFRTPGLYKLVRHPLYVGWLMVFWSTPTMTAAHLLFALGLTTYILIAIRYEERDLVQMHSEYAEYRRRVSMMVPIGAPSRSADKKLSRECA